MDIFSVEVFGARLRVRRRECGLTQSALAHQLGVSQGWLSELETARQGTVQADTVYRLCTALDCTSDYLLGRTDDPTPSRRARPARAGASQAEAAVP